jgi:Mannosyltransferase OCH1 and related enzymes
MDAPSVLTAQAPSLSLSCRASMVSATLLHPDYEHIFLDDAAINEFLKRECPEYEAVYFALSGVQRFDFVRYLAVHHYGGFYFDLDVYLARSLEPLRQHSCVFPFEELTLSRYLRQQHRWDWELGNFGFGAEAGHPFISAVIRNCVRAFQEPTWAAQLTSNIPAPFRKQFVAPNMTGPGLITRTLAENRDLQATVTILFPEDVRDEASWHRFGDYGVHLMNASWRQKDGFVRRRFARAWEQRTRQRLNRDSHRLGGRRSGDWLSVLPSALW